MTKLTINLSLTRWPKWSLHARAVATADMSVDQVLKQLTGFVEALQSDQLKPSFLREHVAAYLAEAFASGTATDFAKVYGDDTPMGDDWRLYMDGVTDETIARQDVILDEMFAKNSREDALTRMVRLDEHMGLLD